MAKLKPDYIEWVLTLNASDAQKEYIIFQKRTRSSG